MKRRWQLGLVAVLLAGAGAALAKDILLKGVPMKSVDASGINWSIFKPPAGWLGNKPDPDPDEDEPDKSAWKLFADICKKATTQHQVGPNHVTTNDAIWETWADDELTFPATPDPAHPPVWPASAQTFPLKRLFEPVQNTLRRLLLQKKPLSPGSLRRPLPNPVPFRGGGKPEPKALSPEISEAAVSGGEEVRRNQSGFQFIVDKKLFYQQGLAAAFTAGETIAFPVDAIEIKARWVPITDAQKPQYHWNYDANGNLYGLVALHIMTKRLPNWTWATFEWTGNAGRCDYIGCHDTFGVTPHDVNAKKPVGGSYPAGALTAALLAVFTADGLGDEWKNYRLKGSQTLFTDTTGRATLLGNSITEAGFVQTSSCITCHGQAAVDKNGNVNPSIGFTSGNQSTNGPLLPSMFWTSANPPKLKYLPIDFVWGILAARPAP